MAANQAAVVGGVDGGGGFNDDGGDDAQVNAIMAEGMGQAAQLGAGRKMPMRNLAQEQGYGDVQNPQALGKAPTMPFDTSTSSSRNYAGIVNSFDPALFATSERILQQAQSLGPTAQNALAYHGSIYTGVPDDFATNRLYIYNTRRRENSIYAFV